MVTLAALDEQLKRAGSPIRGWGRAELKELCHILLPGETIAQAVNGQYEAGFAMLVATDFRVLLIDKKPKYLTLKDIRFDMITELDYSSRLLNSTMRIFTPNRELRFVALSNIRLRKLFAHTQHKVMEIRNHFMMQQFRQQELAKDTPPGVAMAMQRYGQAVDVEGKVETVDDHRLSQQLPEHTQPHETHEEHRRLAAMMGAAGLTSIVHNGKVIKDYMAVPFTQRWRKRPYGYSRSAVTGQQQTAG